MIIGAPPVAPAQAPYWVQDDRAWRITRYADVSSLLKHEAVEVLDVAAWLRKISARLPTALSNLILLTGGSHLLQNGEAHAKSRAEARTLVGGMTRDWAPERMQALAGTLLALAAPEANAVTQLTDPYTATMTASVLAIELDALLACKELERQLSAVYHHATPPLRRLLELEETAAALVGLLRQKLPKSSADEFGLISFFAMASIDTPSSLLDNAVDFLARNPVLADTLRAQPDRIDGFVSEVLRCWPPLKRIVARRATADIAIGDCTIPRDAAIAFDLVRAHFDPLAYANPERFDMERKGPPLLVFGSGPHACLGVSIARLQARAFLEVLCRDWMICLAGESRRSASPDFFDFETIPVRLERR